MTDRHKPRELDRRELLIAVGTLAAAFGLPHAPALAQAGAEAGATPLTTSDFANLSNLIAGFPPADPDITAQFREAFASEIDELVQLYEILRTQPEADWPAAIKAARLGPLAEALVTAWYTGGVGKGADRRIITYLDAFAWYAVGYTKPPTRCDVSFGAWAAQPHEYR
jgi:hypothetical protein